MRLYPAGGVATFRRSKTGKDVVLGGGKLVLPPGVGLHLPITAVHHTEGIWENPNAFTPERFLEVCVPPLAPLNVVLPLQVHEWTPPSPGA